MIDMCLFFFKQKTAYEMRISDWSSTCALPISEAPELLYTRENKPFVSCRVLVNRRAQNDEGEWVNDEPTAHNVKIFGTAATHVHDSCGSAIGRASCRERVCQYV